jgi:hypothetical protein
MTDNIINTEHIIITGIDIDLDKETEMVKRSVCKVDNIVEESRDFYWRHNMQKIWYTPYSIDMGDEYCEPIITLASSTKYTNTKQ